MTGDDTLAPFVLHHHRGFVLALELCRAAEGDEVERRAAAERFLAYFYGEALEHMRREEAALFPLLGAEDSGELHRVLGEHDALAACARRLALALDAGAPDAALLRDTGALVREHILREDRRLYPAVARTIARRERRRSEVEVEHPECHLG